MTTHQSVQTPDPAITARMSAVSHKILVLSGKGGVGKSTVAVNTALLLARAGKRVGLLDIDIHGPSIPALLNLTGATVTSGSEGIQPIQYNDSLSVMSIGFLLRGRDDAVIWRGPRKYSIIRQFLGDVAWGPLDYLVVDSPPGTGDEPLAIIQLLQNPDAAIIVTTPQNLALNDVRRCIGFCRRLDVRVLGVFENMSGFICPHCGETINIFKKDGGKHMARELDIPFIGALPIIPAIVTSSDAGVPYLCTQDTLDTQPPFNKLRECILGLDG
jgi:Mrp family chromosome partitioning ATPase